ncbi:hypothetical protein TKK_0007288 [Trichogramma kaykai]|uniref:Uncharacterized protein n=1 Tax=Trichogramma kaykai TaxID=54128 RepID=A0ABD2XAE9_9HYME
MCIHQVPSSKIRPPKERIYIESDPSEDEEEETNLFTVLMSFDRVFERNRVNAVNVIPMEVSRLREQVFIDEVLGYYHPGNFKEDRRKCNNFENKTITSPIPGYKQ